MASQKKQELLKRWLQRIAPEPDRIESVAPRASALESVGGDGWQSDTAQTALERLERNQPLDQDQMYALEAIIIPGERPVVDIEDDSYRRPEAPFEHLDRERYRAKIDPAIKSIGRLELINHPAPYGGTAFLVGDGVMMTNRHVAELFASGLGRQGLQFKTGMGAGVDFKREIKTEDAEEEPIVFDIQEVIMIHPYWDMALLRVSGLEHLTPLLLATDDPRDMQGEDVAVIGYPAFDPRNKTDLQNDIFRRRFNVKRLQPGKLGERAPFDSFGESVDSITHDSSTLGGNSGSAIVSANTGQVIALHFAGVYLEANYAVPAIELSRDRFVVDAGVNFLDPKPTTTPWDRYWSEAPPAVPNVYRPPKINAQQSAQVGQGAAVTWSIPFEVTVRIGEQTQTVSGTDRGARPSPPSPEPKDVTERAVEPFHDDDYENREGYDAWFLGIKLPPPKILDKSGVSKLDDGRHVIPYNHFSLVMHKARRLAIYTASNIDGRPHKRKPDSSGVYSRKALAHMGENDSEKWFTDPRIPAHHQLPNKFYDRDRKSFDKGHLVRREDVTWGDSFLQIEKANGDTFHVTNCSPQVLSFNRSNRSGIWGKLENEILKQAKRLDERYSVFSGPILDEDDRDFAGVDDQEKISIKIPSRYWKIIVVRNDNELKAYAFLLEQDLTNVRFDELAFSAEWKEKMVSMEELEKRVRLVKFPKILHRSDQFHG